MIDKAFFRSGDTPTLFAAFFYFDISFMVWVMLGPLGVQIAADLKLDNAQKGLMVAVPVLAGAVIRVILGVLVDHLKPRLTGLIAQSIVLVGLLAIWLIGIHSYAGMLLAGIVLGVAGASFAVALPLASRWYPPEHQGTALGIAGAGNSGTVLAALFAPGLAVAFGWINVFGLAAHSPRSSPSSSTSSAPRTAPTAPPPKGWIGVSRRPAHRRRLVVHVLLLRHLRRLRRPCLVAHDLLQRRLRARPRHRRLFHRRLRVRGIAGAADRRRRRRSHRRHPCA